MARETGKQRAIRIPLDYYVASDGLQRGKKALAWIALLVAAGWWASGFVIPEARQRYSRGPVASVHAMWETSCERCHIDFVPIGDEHWVSGVIGQPWDAGDRCETCHAGPPHAANQVEGQVPSCASCHRDHRGRDQSLISDDDGQCTQCHSDLAAHRSGGEPPVELQISSFTGDHPEFRVLARKMKDPGRIKFPHQLHMNLGLRSAEFAPSDVRGGTSHFRVVDGKVQMECANCHVLDAADLLNGALGARPRSSTRGSGGDMLPLTYEDSCRVCHPLRPGSATEEIPHGLSLEQTQGALRDYFARQPFSDGMVDDFAATEVEVLCGYCHELEVDASGVTEIAPSSIPDIWFQHSRFDHMAHRALDCLACHPQAQTDPAARNQGDWYPVDPRTGAPLDTSSEVMLPGIDLCRQCHAPKSGMGETMQGGAGHHCTECHLYHDRDHPRAGGGSEARRGKTKYTIENFIQGPRQTDGGR